MGLPFRAVAERNRSAPAVRARCRGKLVGLPFPSIILISLAFIAGLVRFTMRTDFVGPSFPLTGAGPHDITLDPDASWGCASVSSI